MSEHLVIFFGKNPEEILLWFREHYSITQSVSKRVFLVRDDLPAQKVRKRQGLHIFSTPEIPEEILQLLDDKESLFVAAWRSRFQKTPKKRPGEGLNWDHPGFEPP